MSGLSYRQISDMCGTSATQIENTYYHLNEEILRTNAMAGYKLREGGLIEPEAHEHFKD
jgi:cytochrome c-type biogenesis protein CcmE